jgi:acrylyl-CoA reductase (NADPH)
LQKARCADAVDSVGSVTLTDVLATTRHGRAVAACGWAGGMDLPISVAPFILGGASLFGIESVMSPIADRRTAWGHLASGLDWEKLAAMSEIGLAEVIEAARDVVEGRVRGRIVVKIG